MTARTECVCDTGDSTQDVLLGIDRGTIVIVCGGCRGLIDVNPEDVVATAVPMTLTAVVTDAPSQLWFELAARTVVAA